MRKFKRLIKKYLVLFCTFFIINLFFIWISTNIFRVEEQLKSQNSLISTKAKTIFFNGTNNLEKKDVLDLFKDKKVIVECLIIPSLTKDDMEIKGVYYNYDIDRKYPLLEGRMFTSKEITEKEKVALVGCDLKDKINDNIIKVENENYKVIGILGNKKNNALNNSIYINLNSKDINLNMRAITLDIDNDDTGQAVGDIAKNLKDYKDTELIISEPYGISDPLKTSIGENNIHLILAFLASICLISTVINIGSYWIDKERSIIGIKSLVGGTKISISIKFWIEYITTILLSLIIASMIWIIISYSNHINNMLNFNLFIFLLFINVIVSTLSFIIPIINLMRLNINSIIKENI